MLKRFLLLAFIILFASCIPQKDLVYLSGDPTTKTTIKKLNDAPYRLQVDDVISIDIKSEKNEKLVAFFKKNVSTTSNASNNTEQGYTNQNSRMEGYSISKHGTIRLPYIGEMNVLGYTTKEVRLKLEQEISKYFKDLGDIFVTVDLTGIKYTIIGEVESTGPKVIFQNRITIFDAISYAGDIPVTGDKKNIEVWRNSPAGPKRYLVDLTEASAFDSEVFYILPNDIINVKPLKQKSWGTGTTGLQSLSTIVSVFSLLTTTVLLVRNL